MAHSLRSRIALAIIKRKLPQLMSADPVADMGDGLHIAVVGSGSPLPDPKRGNPCVAVIAGGKVWIVDAGEGASLTMNRMQIAPERIAGVLMTHYHSDHIGGLGSVNLLRWVSDASLPPMRVIGPPGVEQVVGGFNQAYTLDDSYRVGHHGADIINPGSGRMVPQEYSIPDAEDSMVVLDEDGLKVTAFTVEHPPVEPCVGYRFDYKGRSAVVSGDTTYCENLIRASKGADLLLHDALSIELLKLVEDAAGEAGLSARKQILTDVEDYHATAPQAADAAREAGVGALAITHIVPPLPLKGLEDVFLDDASDRFKGPLWLANDGDLYSLEPGGEGIRKSKMIGRGPGG
ncbi:MAG: MBL fold metallo-hydrolase [Solirubrobacterales bacterium]